MGTGYNSPWWLGSVGGGYHPFVSGIVFLVVWSIFWTGMALWHASRRNELGWFVFFLLVHTAGVMEFLYVFLIAKAFSHPTARSKKKNGKS